jgi:hypothetical protein
VWPTTTAPIAQSLRTRGASSSPSSTTSLTS